MKQFFVEISEMKPIEDNMYVTFEWNGEKNYLKEYGYNSRGELATFPDAAIKYQDINGNIHIVLIEWKYTERYQAQDKAEGDSGTTRLNTYKEFVNNSDSPLDLSILGQDIDQQMKALFYEPFYQLMREQLLAKEIENDASNDAQIVSVLHVCPKGNVEYLSNVTSPRLQQTYPEKNVLDIWKTLVKDSCRFLSTTPESLFQAFDVSNFDDDLKNWSAYMSERYRINF